MSSATWNNSDTLRIVERLIAMAAAMGEERAVGKALAAILKPQRGEFQAWQFTALAGVLTALQRRGARLETLLDEAARGELQALLHDARQKAAADNASLAAAATTVLARGLDNRDAADVEALASLLAPQKPPELRGA